MTDIIDLDAPWVPSSARPFRIGDRVRCHPSPECRTQEYRPLSLCGLEQRQHFDWEDGKTGRVSEFRSFRTHPILVHWDQPYFIDMVGYGGARYGPSELELLTPAPEAEACPS